MRMHFDKHRKSYLSAAGAAIAALLAGAALITFGPPAQAAGKLELKFVEPERFADVGRSSFDRERNLKSLSEHFERLAARLPDGQTLKVEVLDVDLAGEQRMVRVPDLRVLRGGADWPVVKLRWSVEGAGAARNGEDRVADMNYQMSTAGLDRGGSDLKYEKRMLDRWFDERVLGKQR